MTLTPLAKLLSVTAVVLLTTMLLIVHNVGMGHAAQPTNSYTVYLPLVVKPECPTQVSAWMSVNRPVVHVGDAITITVAAVNEGCADIFDVQSTIIGGLVEPMGNLDFMYPLSLHTGEFASGRPVFKAVSPGVSIFTGGVLYNYQDRERGWDAYVPASPVSVRILP